jgi:methylmalonyl-CoA mutase
MATAAKIHALGVSSLAAGHKMLLPQLIDGAVTPETGRVASVCFR